MMDCEEQTYRFDPQQGLAVNVFDGTVEKMFVPVNTRNRAGERDHYALVVVRFLVKQIWYLDPSFREPGDVQNNIFRWLKDWKRHTQDTPVDDPYWDGWVIDGKKLEQGGSFQGQSDGCSCALFVCEFMKNEMESTNHGESINYTNMNEYEKQEYRHKMAKKILEKSNLLG